MLHPELQDIYGLESLNLVGNPIVNQNPQLASIRGNESAVVEALESYFSGQGASFGGSGALSSSNLNVGVYASAA